VATRAGVSLRTIYNYFENREARFEGLSVLGGERIPLDGGTMVETDADRMGVRDAARVRQRSRDTPSTEVATSAGTAFGLLATSTVHLDSGGSKPGGKQAGCYHPTKLPARAARI
jgi:hypothetical protein